jgi:hypothetical protein
MAVGLHKCEADYGRFAGGLSYVYLVYNDRAFREGYGHQRPEIPSERQVILKVS